MSRKYHGDESIVLVGFNGAGKKTLAVIAAMAFQRTFVDFDADFRQQYGISPQQYIATNGLKLFREAEAGVSQSLLARHGKGCVISGLGMGNSQQRLLLQDFSQHSPVIYIKRERKVLRTYSNLSEEKFARLYRLGDAYFESCSNFEFFNVTQADPGSLTTQDSDKYNSPCNLRLKDTERIFMRLLHHIFGSPLLHQLHSADPLSPNYTYALQVPLEWLEQPSPDYEELGVGADCVSLIVNTHDLREDIVDRVSLQLSVLRRRTRTPIMIDVEFPTKDKLTQYQQILRLALRLGIDMLPVSLNCPDNVLKGLLAQKGSAIIFGTQRLTPRSQWDYQSLHDQTQRAKSHGLSAMRFSKAPDCSDQTGSTVLDHLVFIREATRICRLPVIAYTEGLEGKSSICLNPTLSPVVLPSLKNMGVTLKEALGAVYSCFLLPSRKFTIFGASVFYSLSPAMHNAAFKANGLPHVYSVSQSDCFDDVRSLLQDAGHGGVAISLPYKTRILPLLDYISPDAADIQAVNTVVMSIEREDTKREKSSIILKGYNTDYIGIRDCIEQHLSPANIIRHGTTALILGAGGMARASVYACHKLGVVDIVICNRTVDNARVLADYYQDWAKSHRQHTPLRVHVQESLASLWPAHLQQPTIIVSCIPAHGVGDDPPPRLSLPDAWLESKTGGVFIELAYNPLVTPLMTQMQQKGPRGWVVVDGLQVLVGQGIAQFELFTQRPAPVHAMKRALRLQQDPQV